MTQGKNLARWQTREDCRVCLTIIGFVYSPLVLLVGAAAIIGLG